MTESVNFLIGFKAGSRQFQGSASVVIYSNCQCSSAFCWSLTIKGCIVAICWKRAVPLAFWLFTCVVFIFSAVLVVVSHSHLVFGAGCGIRLYRFPIIAFLFAFL